MKIGLIDIKKAYFGLKELSPTNAFVGEKPLIEYRPLRFTSSGNSTIGLAKISANQVVEYSFDNEVWHNLDSLENSGNTINLSNEQVVYIRGILSGDNIYYDGDYTQFQMTGSVAASGNINYLWDYENLDAPLKEYCGYGLFSGCTSLTSTPELPATTLSKGCYYSMFYGCINLTNATKLPATTLPQTCYCQLFMNCTSLETVYELPATTLAYACYGNMFAGCTSLTTAPELPVTILIDSSCEGMFRGCTSLTTAPSVLPATTLAYACYSSMFEGCTSLTTSPALPATTLAEICYAGMFNGCASLTTPPKLPATTLVNYCYSGMFRGCTSLATAPELPAITLVKGCYGSMFKDCTNLNYIKCLAVDISPYSCTTNWVSGVSQTGTFVKVPGMNDWTTGSSGIPSGWTVENYGDVVNTAEE